MYYKHCLKTGHLWTQTARHTGAQTHGALAVVNTVKNLALCRALNVADDARKVILPVGRLKQLRMSSAQEPCARPRAANLLDELQRGLRTHARALVRVLCFQVDNVDRTAAQSRAEPARHV